MDIRTRLTAEQIRKSMNICDNPEESESFSLKEMSDIIAALVVNELAGRVETVE